MFQKLLMLILFGGVTLCFAQSSIDAQIAVIKSAHPKERVVLMNNFKRQLIKMNQEERRAAISAMRAKVKSQGHSPSQMHTQEMQMQHSQKMYQMQNMDQHQMPNQTEQKMNMQTPMDRPPINHMFRPEM